MNRLSLLSRFVLAAIGVLGILAPSSSRAQAGYGVLFSIQDPGSGFLPYGSVTDGGDGRLYGATNAGGSGVGVLYSIAKDGSGYLEYPLDGVNGGAPYSPPLVGSDGLLHGVTSSGGGGGDGVLYSMQKDGSGYLVRYSFLGPYGNQPIGAPIIGRDGRLYGTTFKGGLYGGGVTYSVNLDGSDYDRLHSFGPQGPQVTSPDGEEMYAGVIQASDERLYGTCLYGGANNVGVVYGMDSDGSNFEVVLSMESAVTGEKPLAGVIEGTDGRLYGVTTLGGGGAADSGTIFSVAKTGGAPTVIHVFTEPGAVNGSLTQTADGRLYGMQTSSVAGGGTIFSVATDRDDFRVEHNFLGAPSDGASPAYCALLLSSDGRLYGTTALGGALDAGAVFSFTAPTATPINPDTPGQLYVFTTVEPAVAPGQAVVTARRTGTLGAVTVNYATVDGTAIAGRDYTATSGTLSFAAGQTDQTITVPLLAGALTGLKFNVQLSNATGGATIGNPGSVTLTISGVDPAPSPYIALAADAYAKAAAYFAAGDQANGYFCYAYYEYYLYLLDPSGTGHLTSYYENLANAYYLSYLAAGDPAAAVAWANYYRSFE